MRIRRRWCRGPRVHGSRFPPDFRWTSLPPAFRGRFMVEGPGGEVIVSDTVPDGSVVALRNGSKKMLISGLDRPYGLALWHEYLYVGEPESLKRYKYDSKALTAGPGEEVVSMAGFSKGHVTRTILVDERAD